MGNHKLTAFRLSLHKFLQRQIGYFTYWVSRDLSFSHEGLRSVVQFLLQEVIIYVNIKPTRENATQRTIFQVKQLNQHMFVTDNKQ